MTDLTDADLEAITARAEVATNEAVEMSWGHHSAECPYSRDDWDSDDSMCPTCPACQTVKLLSEDIPALIATLREARAERDAMSNLYAQEGHKSLVLLNENTSLLAENRLLREAVEDLLGGWRYIRQAHGDLYGVGWDRAQHKGEIALAETPLTAAEVARVKRLEKVAEAARAFRNEYRKDFGAWKDLRDDLFQLLDESDEDAALAELDAGEVNDAT